MNFRISCYVVLAWLLSLLTGVASHAVAAAAVTAVELIPAESSPSAQSPLVLKVVVEDAGADTHVFACHDSKPILLDGRRESDGKAFEVRLPVEALAQCLEGQGRSLWLAVGEGQTGQQTPKTLSPKFRFDLPAVDLEKQALVSAGKQGVQIRLHALNILPGSRVVYCQYYADGSRSLPRVLCHGGEPPCLGETQQGTDPTLLTIQWRSAASAGSRRTDLAQQTESENPSSWLFYIENVDGSRSRTLLLDWNGARFTKGREFQEAIPAPTEQIAVVPDVTGMALDRAAVVLAESGFHPVPVSPESLVTLPTALLSSTWLQGHIVHRQGLAGDKHAALGSVVFLSVRGQESQVLADARRALNGEAPRGGLSGKVDRAHAKNKEGGLEDNTDVQQVSDDSADRDEVPAREPLDPTGGLSGTAKKGTGTKSAGGLSDESVVPTMPIDPEAVSSTESGQGQQISVDPKGGLEGTATKGMAKERPAGLIDDTLADVIEIPVDVAATLGVTPSRNTKSEPPADTGGSDGPADEDTISVAALTRIPDLTGLTLGKAKRALEEKALHESHDGDVSDFEVVATQDPLPGYQEVPKNVRLQFAVPVPDVTRRRYPDAIKRLSQYGLRSDVPLEGHEKHGCIGQDPPPYTKEHPSTLPPGGLVTVTLGVLVPDLSGKTVEVAARLLSKDGLVGDYDSSCLNTDVVIDQQPPPHSRTSRSIAKLGSKVHLQLGRMVPDVERMTLDKARQTLDHAGFSAHAPDTSDQSATVLHQDPRPGAIVPMPCDVRLSLNVTVPDVTGLALTEAKTRLEQAGFVPKVTSNHPDARDIVRGQNPTGGDTDSQLGSTVTLSPVVAVVPNVLGKSIQEATMELHDQRFDVDYDHKLAPGTLVTIQNPKAGEELERGKPVRVRCTVKVPNVMDAEPERGIQAIAEANLEADMEVKWVEGDRILRQRPVQGRLVEPLSKVSIWFGRNAPELRGLTEQEARRTLEDLAIRGDITKTIEEETPDESKKDLAVVFAQNPKPGKPIVRSVGDGAVVHLVMKSYVYVPPVPVGDYVNFDTMTVDRLLRQNGLLGKVKSTRVVLTQNQFQADRKKYVEWQSIAAGQMVPRGTRIEFGCIVYQYNAPAQQQPIYPSGQQQGHFGGDNSFGDRGGGGVF